MRYQELLEYKMIKVNIPDVLNGEGEMGIDARIFKNPTRSEFLILLKKANSLRGLIDTQENLYIWNAGDAIHEDIKKSLALDFYANIFFDTRFDFHDQLNLVNIDGIFFGATTGNRFINDAKNTIHNSKFLRRVLGLKDGKLTEKFENVTLSEPHKFLKYGETEKIIIQIDNLFFRVVLENGNLWWGIVPNTNTKNQIPKNSGIMKVLVPALKKAIRILISRAEPQVVEIDSKTNKGRDLYRSWRNIHPDYRSKFGPRGIVLIRKEELSESSNGFKEWFAGSKIVDRDGSPLPVYHGTNQQFDKFSFENAAQRIIWFSSNRDKITRGESGAASSKIIRTAYLKITNPAGWEEYEPLTLDQIEQQGFDGIILDDDYVVFSPEQVWLVE